MQTSNNLYRKLGVNKDASPFEIQHAYRTLAKVYHPDGTVTNEVMAKAFVEITSAADILRDRQKRSLYDSGYINNFGDLTDAGRGREQRRRTLRVLSSAFVLSFVVALPVAIWSILETERGAVTKITPKTGPEERGIALPNSSESSPTSVVAQNKIDVSAPRAEPEGPANSNMPGPIRTEKASAGDDHDYLPPSALIRQPEGATPVPDPSAKRPAETAPSSKHRQQQTLANRPAEGKKKGGFNASRIARLSKRQPDDNWFGTPQPQFHGEDSSRSSTLRTASCLACLTRSDGNCVRICP